MANLCENIFKIEVSIKHLCAVVSIVNACTIYKIITLVNKRLNEIYCLFAIVISEERKWLI